MSTQVSTRKTIKSLTKMPIALYFPGKKTAEDESAGLSKLTAWIEMVFMEQTLQSIHNLNSLKRKFWDKKHFLYQFCLLKLFKLCILCKVCSINTVLVVADTQSDSIQCLILPKNDSFNIRFKYCFTQDSIQNIVQFKKNLLIQFKRWFNSIARESLILVE